MKNKMTRTQNKGKLFEIGHSSRIAYHDKRKASSYRIVQTVVLTVLLQMLLCCAFESNNNTTFQTRGSPHPEDEIG